MAKLFQIIIMSFKYITGTPIIMWAIKEISKRLIAGNEANIVKELDKIQTKLEESEDFLITEATKLSGVLGESLKEDIIAFHEDRVKDLKKN